MFNKLKKILTKEQPITTTQKQPSPIDLSNYTPKGQVEEIKAPKLTDNNNKYTISQWNVQPGSIVKKGDILCSISISKAEMEFESFIDGKILWCIDLQIEFAEGTTICKIEQL